jgi:hypothetical protein
VLGVCRLVYEFSRLDAAGNDPSNETKMEVVTVEEGTSEEDNSTNIQPIRTKQKATTRSRSNEQVVTVNLIEFLTSEPLLV